MSSQSIKELANFLPGGTYISFTVIAQLTTNTTNMVKRLNMSDCDCVKGYPRDSTTCTAQEVCGVGYYEMSLALVIISAFLVFMLAWYGEDLTAKKETVTAIRCAKEAYAAAAAAAGQGLSTGKDSTLPGQPSTTPGAAAAAAGPPLAAAAPAMSTANTPFQTPQYNLDYTTSLQILAEALSDTASSMARDTAAAGTSKTLTGGAPPAAASDVAAHDPTATTALAAAAQPPRHISNLASTNTAGTPIGTPHERLGPAIAGLKSIASGRVATATSAPPAVTAVAAISSSGKVTVVPGNKRLDKDIKRQEEFVQKVANMTEQERRRKYIELVVAQVVRSVGAVVIFLVLAVLTPPVSTCILPPCRMPSVVLQVVPLLVSFTVSAFVAVQKKVIRRVVFAVDWLLRPEDRKGMKFKWCMVYPSPTKEDQPQLSGAV